MRRGFHQRREGRTGDQRHIPAEDENQVWIQDAGHGLLHGMAGTQLLRLKYPVRAEMRETLGHFFPAVTIDDRYSTGLERSGGKIYVFEQGASSQLVQDLGQA